MLLIQLRDVYLNYGDKVLFDGVNLSLAEKESIALVGRNGTGKSTFLKLLQGEIQPDEGEIIYRDGLQVTKLIQQIPNNTSGNIQSIIAMGDHHCGKWLAEYYRNQDKSPSRLLREKLNETNAWGVDQRIKILLSKFDLDAVQEFSTLSGGYKRRVLLAQSLVGEPDLLLLDEPTNHLDISTIEWMEQMLLSLKTTLVFVSHDRSFINNLATRILDLDRASIRSWTGNFDRYISEKDKAIEVELNQDRLFDKKLAKEEIWIRKGIQARRRRNQGRVRALKLMRREQTQRRLMEQSVSFSLNQAGQSGQLVVEAVDVSYGHNPQHPIIRNFNATVLRGDKVGILGPNGCGKSTLTKLLTGELTADSGTVRLGSRLEIAYLDQERKQIQENISLLDNVAGGRSEVAINEKSVHVMTYLKDFLFTPAQIRAPVSALSGGERNRLMLAKLFTRPFNLLILDEPTNDLDIDTLELLEQKLLEYKGTLLLVSHDRSFLNNIVSSVFVFEGQARVIEYIGGYDDWVRQRKTVSQRSMKKSVNKPKATVSKPRKLSYKEKRELENLPEQIEIMESELASLQELLAQADFYKQENSIIIEANENLKLIQAQLEKAYRRWQELENI